MAKHTDMTRARKAALTTILRTARAATRHVPMSASQRQELEEALELFDGR